MLRGFGVNTIKITIEGMSCLDCAVRVQRALAAVPMVKFVGVTIGAATVDHENASPEQLLQAIRTAGDFTGEIRTPGFTPQIPRPQAWLQKTVGSAMAKILGKLPDEAGVSETGATCPAIRAGCIGQSRMVSPIPSNPGRGQ
jgi:copper chaperone CopZ